MTLPLILTVLQQGLFIAAWLLVAAMVREERRPAIGFVLFGVLLAITTVLFSRTSYADPLPTALAFSSDLVTASISAAASDAFIHRRIRFRHLWSGLLAAGLALLLTAAHGGPARYWLDLTHDGLLLLMLALPLALFFGPLTREFGRLGLLALTPFALFTLFAAGVLVQTAVAGPGGEPSGDANLAGDGDLIGTFVAAGAFQLTWLALIVGRQVAIARRLARFDTLTGTLQRAAIEGEIEAVFEIAERHDRALGIAFLDVDHFKTINDRGGHRYGDDILRQLAGVIKDAIRTGDRVGRWGGEEFLIVLPETDAGGARVLVDRIQGAIRTAAIPVPDGCDPLAVSIGVANLRPGERTWSALVARADAAMYEAKRLGRNATVFDAPSAPAGDA